VKPFLGVNQSLMPAHYIGSRRPVMSSVWGTPSGNVCVVAGGLLHE